MSHQRRDSEIVSDLRTFQQTTAMLLRSNAKLLHRRPSKRYAHTLSILAGRKH